MSFGGKKEAPVVSASRLATVAGTPAQAPAPQSAAAPQPRRRGELQPDMSRIRPRGIEETPEARRRRLRAKAVNFSTTIFARIVILAGAGLYAWHHYQFAGQFHRGVAIGMIAMVADLGRVVMKASEPGTK